MRCFRAASTLVAAGTVPHAHIRAMVAGWD